MNLKHQIFMALLGCVFILCSAFAIAQHSPATAKLAEDFLKEILAKYAAFHTTNREDKVYIHCDKPQYEPGETVWFAVYLRNGDDLKASEKSGIVHVEIMNPRGAVERSYQIVAKEGVAQGDFLIEENAVGGLYKIRAFSNWMMNDKEPAIFEKEITVQEVVLPRLKMKLDFPRDGYGAGANVSADLSLQSNENQALANFPFTYAVSIKGEQIIQQKGTTDKEGNASITFTLPKNLTSADGLLNVMIDYQGQTEAISRAVPILLNNVKLSFYPEGGDLVTGLPARVGFKAMNEFGKPTDIEGYVTDNAGNTVANLASYHKGMGAFSFTPKAGQVYMAHITEPRGITEAYPLPTALDKGYVLKSENVTDNKLTFKIYSSENEKMGLVINVRGKNYASAEINAQKGENTYSFPTNDLPAGVAQVTLFDSKGIERCERLVFVNPNKQLSIDIKTDKEKYLPREKVNMTINVKDERGMPMPAQLSLSVVNDQLLSFADDKSSNILSWLLVESDLKGKVEEPNFYFDKKEEKAPLALDYLLMTAGWRRFTWKEVQSTSPRAISYLAEDCVIAGTIYDYQNYDAATSKYKPAEGATITIMGTNITTITDKDGKYSFKGHEFTQPFNLSVTYKGNICQYIYVGKYGNNYDGQAYIPAPSPPVAVESMQEMERPTMGSVDVVETVAARPNPVKKVLNKAIPKAKPTAARAEAKPQGDLDKIEIKGEKQAKGKAIAGKEVAKIGKKQPMVLQGEILANKHIAINQDAKARMQDDDWAGDEPFKPEVQGTAYYRARQFPTVAYPSVPVENELRSDFRSTIYWNGNVTTDKSGKAEVSFFTSDEITSFNATIEGIASDGMVGRAEKKFFSQLPVSMSAKLPVEVIAEDELTLPFTFVNNTNYPMKGSFALEVPKGFELMAKQNMENLTVNLPANSAITEYYPFKVTLSAAKKDSAMPKKVIRAAMNFGNYSDKIEQEIKIIPKGFPVAIAGSGTDVNQTFNIDLVNPVDFSIQATVSAYPSSISEMLSGLEGMLQEPGGCFEQVSSSNYPNILVLDYLQATNQIKPDISRRAKTLIEKGYKMLTAYESKSGGFEWFGGDPGHEGLTAYGLMEFMDMKKAGLSVDEKMLSRTAQWLMDRRDEKGGFKRNPRALHEFGLTDEQTMSAYIVWALSEFQQANLSKELESCKNEAIKTKNPYQLGLMANALANYGKKAEAKTLVEMLATIQNEKGVWNHSQNHRSAPGSEGEGLSIETASLALMAMMKIEGSDISKIKTIAEFIRKNRNSYGSFGNTNSTVLALKALVQYAIFSKRTDESGDLTILIDGKKVANRAYSKGDQSTITINGLEKYLSAGKHSVEIKYGNGVKNPLPYTLSVRYYTSLPNADAECKVDMKTSLAAKEVKVGQTLRLTTTLTNKKAEGQGMAMAIVGVPAGLTVQPWQLKELKEKNVFDFYETKGNNVILYYRQLKPSETRTINLDLKAEIPGVYQANASSAYLYYVNEHKHWVGLDKVIVTK